MTDSSTRRRLLALCGTIVSVGVAGCAQTSESATPESDGATAGMETPTAEPTTADETPATGTPSCRQAVVVAARTESPTRFRAAVGEPLAAFRAYGGVREALVTGVSTGDVRQGLSEAGIQPRWIADIEYCGEPLCEATTRVRFRSDASATRVAEAFPDAVATYAMTAGGGDQYWLVYSRAESTETVADRLEIGGFETATASVATLAACTSEGLNSDSSTVTDG